MKPRIEYREKGGSFAPLDWSVWSQILLNNYSSPRGSKFRFTWTEPSSFLLARRSDKFKVVVYCDFKLNRFVNYSVSMKGVDHRDEISMTDITTGVWFSMFEDFEYNPLLPLIKPPYVHTTIRKTDLGDAEEWKYGSWKPKLQPAEFELKNLGDLKIKDIEQVLQAIEYLNFVDWFNGTNPVRQMAVKGIYNNFAEYNSFIDKYISSSDRAKGSTDSTFKDEVKAEANRLLKPLYRNPYLDRSKRGKNAQGKTKKVGGKLTEEGEKILFKWLSISNQDPTLINSVKLEA